MSTSTLIECDRCGAVQPEHKLDRARWLRIYAATRAGTDVVGNAVTPADLCGDCNTELRDFIGQQAAQEALPDLFNEPDL